MKQVKDMGFITVLTSRLKDDNLVQKCESHLARLYCNELVAIVRIVIPFVAFKEEKNSRYGSTIMM